MSVLPPHPAQVGLMSVVSRSVQSSPLVLHWPEFDLSFGNICAQWGLTRLKVTSRENRKERESTLGGRCGVDPYPIPEIKPLLVYMPLLSRTFCPLNMKTGWKTN